MSKYKNREELFKASQTLTIKEWNNWINSLTISPDKIHQPLYHISFNAKLPTTMKPQPVYASGGEIHEIYNEPLPPRISTSTSVLGCWRGIYANFSDMFERDNHIKEIDVHVYLIIPNKNSKILTPQTASSEWLLYDAHMTDEYSVFGEATATYLGHVVVENTSRAPDHEWDMFYPFDKTKYKKLFSNPPFKVITSTNNFYDSLSEVKLNTTKAIEGRNIMNTWNQSINPAVEGVRFDQLKERLKSKFGLNDKANIETLSKNMKTIVTVSQMRTLNNSVINDYCDELDKANQTSATVSEMAKAYLIDKAYKNKQVYMLSVMAGVDYSNIAPKTNRYTTLMSKVTISEEATVSNQRDAERRLKDLSTLIDLGTEALSAVTDIYAQTKTPSKTNLNCQINYETILKKHSTLMHDGAQVTQESTNDGPKLLLEDMVKTTLIKHDPALLNKTKQLIPPANKLLAQSKLVDKTSDVIWKEWEQVNKTQVEIANLYSKLRDRKPSSNIEGRQVMSDWLGSLEASVEGKTSDVLTKIKHKVFGQSDRALLKEFYDNTHKKVSINDLLSSTANGKLKGLSKLNDKSNNSTITWGEVLTFYTHTQILSKKLKYSYQVCCGKPFNKAFQGHTGYVNTLHTLGDLENEDLNERQLGKYADKIETCLSNGERIVDDMFQALQVGTTFNASQMDSKITLNKIATHHSDIFEQHGLLSRDNSGIIVSLISGILPTKNMRLKDLLSRAVDLDKKHEQVWQLTSEVMKETYTLYGLELEVAKIYKELRDRKPSPNIEGRQVMSDWTSSLTASTEDSGFSKIKSDVAKFFGVGDRERVETLRKAGDTKVDTTALTNVKDPVIGRAYLGYLMHNKQKTTTVANMNSFYMSTLILKQNLEKALTVASGHSYVPLLKNLPTLMAKTTSLVETPTDNNFDTTLGKFSTLISDMEKTYSTINKGLEVQKPMKADSVKQGVVFKDILEHHQTMLQLYWENDPDSPFKLKRKLNQLKGEVGRASTNHEKLSGLSSRLDAVIEQIKKTSGQMWAIALEWGLLNKGEIKMANIYDSLSSSKPSSSTESKDWPLAFGLESNTPEEEKKDMGEVSDGDHTFNELYMHRTTLFNIILCQNKDKAWKSKLHDDGTMFDNYFIAGIETPEGNFTYHQHVDFWDKFDVEERDKAPEWDGHKSSDITRLYSLL